MFIPRGKRRNLLMGKREKKTETRQLTILRAEEKGAFFGEGGVRGKNQGETQD